MWVVPERRPLVPDPDAAVDAAIRQIADLLATAYLRLNLPRAPEKQLDSPETESRHVTGG